MQIPRRVSTEADWNEASCGRIQKPIYEFLSRLRAFRTCLCTTNPELACPMQKKVVTLVVHAQPAADFAAGVREMQ